MVGRGWLIKEILVFINGASAVGLLCDLQDLFASVQKQKNKPQAPFLQIKIYFLKFQSKKINLA